MLLEIRNPQKDTRVLKFKAELIDKKTDELVDGLCTASQNEHENDSGWAGKSNNAANATTAMISLDGKKNQTFILPLYVDYFKVIEGNYKLRVTLSGNQEEKIHEVPFTIAKTRNMSLFAVSFAILSFLILVFSLNKIKKCVYNIGAKGAITVALFSAIAFGSIVVPTTILGDLVHVILGPFSGLVTGILSGILLYILLMSLLVIYRKPGIPALMFLIKWMLAGLMFGRFTPIGILSCAVYIVVIESILYFSGFYKKDKLNNAYILFISLLLGCGDAFITMINLEQLMFFYRLYYADWYIGLYMLVNGMIYSAIGAWLGYKVGIKLQQVTGE